LVFFSFSFSFSNALFSNLLLFLVHCLLDAPPLSPPPPQVTAMHEYAIGPLLQILRPGTIDDLECVKQAVFAVGTLAEVMPREKETNKRKRKKERKTLVILLST